MILFMAICVSVTRSCSMKIGTIMSTASAVSAVTAHWLMSPSPARMTLFCAMTVTATNSLLNVLPVTRPSCLVRAHQAFCIRARSFICFSLICSGSAGENEKQQEEEDSGRLVSISSSQLQGPWFNPEHGSTVSKINCFTR